jgi:hypothetical protein
LRDGINAVSQEAAGILTPITRGPERHLGVCAQRQALLLALKSIFVSEDIAPAELTSR